MKNIILSLGLLLSVFKTQSQTIEVSKYGAQPNSFKDATVGVQKAIEACRNQQKTVINFKTGRYDFWPDKAVETSYFISNSSSKKELPIKQQRVGLMFKNLKNITLNGNGARFVFHGKMISWVIDHSENIKIQNISVDYERPGMSEMTIKSISPTSMLAAVHPDSKFDIINNQIEWYGDKWVTRNYHGILVKPSGIVRYSPWDLFLNSKAEKTGTLLVRFTGDFSQLKADTGDVQTVRDAVRDVVGVFQTRSKNISLKNVHMNYMHGLGIVSQFCENLDYDSVFVESDKNSGRVIASSADGAHFSGCKGQIMINHSRFKGLHDDPVNVHGTHLLAAKTVSPTRLTLRFGHPQSYGFEAFIEKDTVGFLHPASLQIFGQGVVKSVKLISENEMLVEFEKPVPIDLKPGDALENMTWTPSLTIKNSRFERTVSRGTLVTTRRKVVIENNVYYRTGMQAILIENDAMGWYESGPVTNVTIRNNQFIECGYNSGEDNYPIKINPETHQIIPGYYVHKNILITDNTFKIYDYPLLSARSTKGLTFVNNTVLKSTLLPAKIKRPAFKLSACTGVKIADNHFYEGEDEIIETQNMTNKDFKSNIHAIIK